MSLLCRLYGVSRAGYYAWRKRQRPSRHERADERLLARISREYEASQGIYGSPRVHRALAERGVHVGRKRVERIMRQNGLKARAAKIYRRKAGCKAFFTSIPNRSLKRLAKQPDRVWVGDLSYVQADQRYYLAGVMDRCSRRVVGTSLGEHKSTQLTLAALNRAVRRRRPRRGLIFHTDRGIEYAAFEFQERLKRLGIVQSMNRPGRMNDNAYMESFFHSLKSEALHGRQIRTREELERIIRGYVRFYNHRRLHSGLGYRTPVDYEREKG